MSYSRWMSLLWGVSLLGFGCDSTDLAALRFRSSSPSSVGQARVSALATLGQTAAIREVQIRFVSQRDCGSPEAGTPIPGYRVWAAELEITNSSGTPITVNPFHFGFEDAQKNHYTTSLIGCPPLLDARRIPPGDIVRGFVPFEIPKATPVAVLTYEPARVYGLKPYPLFHAEL
jgi:hypothetical protein